jgi:DNA-binding response OmpR family regulator
MIRMSQTSRTVRPFAHLERQYEQLRRSLGQIGYISQGSVQDRTRRLGGGAGYQWTRKVARKTVTVALTPQEFQHMKAAVGNYRKVRQRLKAMEALSRRIIFQTTPHPNRRKRLSQKVLGTK